MPSRITPPSRVPGPQRWHHSRRCVSWRLRGEASHAVASPRPSTMHTHHRSTDHRGSPSTPSPVASRVASEPRRQRDTWSRSCHAIIHHSPLSLPRPQRPLHSRRCVSRRLCGEASHASASPQAMPELPHRVTTNRRRSAPITALPLTQTSHRAPARPSRPATTPARPRGARLPGCRWAVRSGRNPAGAPR